MRPVTTPDFMFGQLVAPPPPASAKVCSDAEDVLRCFHESGSPATSDLSPITVVRLYRYIPIYIIESVDSITKDERGFPLTQYITNGRISRAG